MRGHHHHRRMKMRRIAQRRGLRPGFGPGPRGFGFMHGFLDENPEFADKMLRYGVAQMRAEGHSDEEIRDHLDALHECGHLSEIDIDSVL